MNPRNPDVDRASPLFPAERRRHRIYRGLVTERQEHLFTRVSVVFVLLYAAAWVAAIAQIRAEQKAPTTFGDPRIAAKTPLEPPSVTGAMFGSGAKPSTPYLTDAMLEFLHPLRGESGSVRYAPVLPGAPIASGAGQARAVIEGEPRPDFSAPEKSGIYQFGIALDQAVRGIEDISIVTLVPRTKKRAGRIGSYHLGSWPWESGGKPRSARYAPPEGFIEVTRENQNFHVSEHFKLRDFLTKDQRDVWPKYLLLDPQLIDKLELTIQQLERQGVRVDNVHVMSGFRTPRYNHSGGNVAGRANLSRHMYGDAADVYVDNNRDGQPDDITGDRRVTIKDAERFAQAAELVERQYRSLVGGIGVYTACCGHGPFTHIDVRGFRARWRGTGNG